MHHVADFYTVLADKGLEGCEIELGLQMGPQNIREKILALIVAISNKADLVGPWARVHIQVYLDGPLELHGWDSVLLLGSEHFCIAVL